MSNKFCLTIKHSHSDTDQATVGFVVANAALGSEKETLVFLSTDGVWIAKRGEAEKIVEDAPFAPLAELVQKFLAGGGKIMACAPCCKKRGIEEGDLIDGVQIAGGAALVEFLSDGTPCVDY